MTRRYVLNKGIANFYTFIFQYLVLPMLKTRVLIVKITTFPRMVFLHNIVKIYFPCNIHVVISCYKIECASSKTITWKKCQNIPAESHNATVAYGHVLTYGLASDITTYQLCRFPIPHNCNRRNNKIHVFGLGEFSWMFFLKVDNQKV